MRLTRLQLQLPLQRQIAAAGCELPGKLELIPGGRTRLQRDVAQLQTSDRYVDRPAGQTCTAGKDWRLPRPAPGQIGRETPLGLAEVGAQESQRRKLVGFQHHATLDRQTAELPPAPGVARHRQLRFQPTLLARHATQPGGEPIICCFTRQTQLGYGQQPFGWQ